MAQAARAARDPQPATAPFDRDPHPGRRTITITGRPGQTPRARHLRIVEPGARGSQLTSRMVQVERRRPARRSAEQLGAHPDRLAKWALLMALFLVFVVIASS